MYIYIYVPDSPSLYWGVWSDPENSREHIFPSVPLYTNGVGILQQLPESL